VRKRARSKGDGEAALQSAVRKYFVLNRFNCVAMRNNSGGRSNGVKYGLRIVGEKIESGGPDFLLSQNGRTVGIELKKKGGKPRGDQLRWLKHVSKHMSLFLCDDVADVVSASIAVQAELPLGLWERIGTGAMGKAHWDGWVKRG
jgi:hypothetical protein